MDEKIQKFCPNCSQLYVISLTPSKSKNNLPLFLPCGHSMCENCILNIIKCMEAIECKVCLKDVEFPSNDAMTVVQNILKLHEHFPVNKFVVGELALSLIEKPLSKPPIEDHFIDLKKVLKHDAKGQCLECQAPTSKMCQQCTTILCESCFNKSHKNFVIFKNHELQPIDIARQPNYCNTHKEKPLDYYCHDCKRAICIDCMMIGGEKSCKNHNVVPKEEVNETFMNDIKEITPQVDEIYRRLTKTAVDIGYLLHNYDNDAGSTTDLIKTVANIEQHFSKYLSIVQKHKEEVIKIVLNLKCSEKDSLQKAKMDVVDSVKRANDLLKQIEAYSKPQLFKQANLPALLDEAKQIVKTPWYLNKNDSDKEALKITVNEDLCSLANDYVHLEGNVTAIYKLYATDELAEDVEIPPAPKTVVHPPELPKDVRETNKPKVEKSDSKGLYKKVPKYRSKSGSVSSLNSLGSDGSSKNYLTHNDSYQQPIVQPVSPFPESQIPQQLREGSQELIYISHIVNPHNFYVQRACHQGIVKEMLREFRNAVAFTKPSTNHISLGKTYLAFNKVDNMWQRCRVVGIDKSDNKAQAQVQVFYFDFGSMETVSIDRLRLIPAQRIQCPYPLALNCSLANCEPKTGAWTSEDSILIQNIIDNKQAVIHVRRITTTSAIDFKVECDVMTFEHGVSLAHALVFHERAKMPNPKLRYPAIIGVKDKPRLYMSHNDFKSDSTEPVYLTHVVSPDKFFVRKQHLQAVYEKICEDLEQEYNVSSNSGTVYLPEVGMVCVVNVSKYGSNEESVSEACRVSWARGVITELHGRGRVRVSLPDNGLELPLHWTQLRYILPKFTAIRAIATECHLAGVTPLSKKWNTGSVDLLKRFEGNLLQLQVEDNRNWTHQNRSSIGVILHDKNDPDNVICINQEMIKHKYAVSIGVFMFNKKPVEEQVITNKSPLVTQQPAKPKNNKITILKKLNENKCSESDLQAKDKGPLRLEAKILHYQSPSLIYISLVHQQKTFNELFENMQKYYSKDKRESKTDWKVGDRCCTVCNQSQTWRRAVIMELENDNAKVFYSDFACIETVPISNLKVLTSEFAAFGDAAIMCHLYGIVPAVGEEWPSLTKEFLKELLDAYKRVFITKKGNFKDKSMPIEIWVYHTIQGDALEPNKSEWRCLNNKIIEQGLGIPDKSQIVTTENPDDNKEENMLSFLNITGSVNEWLQLEPVPLIPVTKKPDKDSISESPTPCQDGEDMKSEEDVSNVMYISDWLTPEPITCKEFTGVPTYIDNDGIIYLHDIKQQDTLDLIRKALDVRFKAPDPKAKFMKWSVGEPCVALYFLDNKYYRGRVTEVNTENSSCLIHYVDYGNEESCDFANLRKSVPLHQIPIQAHRCILNRIRPIGKQWDRTSLDYIHKSIVEKQCYIQVTGEPQNGIIPIELKYNKLWINEHLVDFEMAEFTDGSKALVKKFAPTKDVTTYKEETSTVVLDSGPDYMLAEESDTAEPMTPSDDSIDVDSMKGVDWNKLIDENSSIDGNYITYPKNSDEEFVCNITIINNVNTLELNIISDDETTNVYESMFEELQAESQSLPPLDGIFENKACVAIFPEDGRWYRASILQFSEAKNQVKVRYIDYGNVEVISLADIREILEEWTKLPPATISVQLFGVHVNPDLDTSDVLKEYANILLDKGPYQAKILSYENDYPLVELRNDKNELVYNKLIEDKILLLKSE